MAVRVRWAPINVATTTAPTTPATTPSASRIPTWRLARARASVVAAVTSLTPRSCSRSRPSGLQPAAAVHQSAGPLARLLRSPQSARTKP